MFSVKSMPSTTSFFSLYTTITAFTMLIRTVLNDVQSLATQLLPKTLREKILSRLEGLFGNLSSLMTITIDDSSGSINEMYEAAEVYLHTISSASVQHLKVSKAPQETDFTFTAKEGQKIIDTFEGIQLTWEFITHESHKSSSGYDSDTDERKSIQLSFDKTHKEKVLRDYLQHVVKVSDSMKQNKKVVKLISRGNCNSINLNHPSTFDTLAMDPKMKKMLVDDLDRFLRRKDFYKGVGKVWKRGYLLYGPPGTGKSSLVAAMANYLKFDIYDMELTSLRCNADLRRFLVSTTNRSIIVIEDIDCSIDLDNRQSEGPNKSNSQITLSGLLNFVDGLWSGCGDERIIVFTTNYRERLDPALLRPGRMDKQIHMSYLTPDGFKILALNYLKIKSHSLFPEIEELIRETEVTPAEVAEELMQSEDADVALLGLVEFLGRKKEQKKCENSEVEQGKDDQGNAEENGCQKVEEEEEKGDKER